MSELINNTNITNTNTDTNSKDKYKIDILLIDINNEIKLQFNFYLSNNNKKKYLKEIIYNDEKSLKGEFLSFIKENNINYERIVNLYYLSTNNFYELSHLPSLSKSKCHKVIDNNLKDSFLDSYKDEVKEETKIIKLKNKRLLSTTSLIKKEILNKYKKIVTSLNLICFSLSNLATFYAKKVNNEYKDTNAYLIENEHFVLILYFLEHHFIKSSLFSPLKGFGGEKVYDLINDVNSFKYHIERLFDNYDFKNIYFDSLNRFLIDEMDTINPSLYNYLKVDSSLASLSFPLFKNTFLTDKSKYFDFKKGFSIIEVVVSLVLFTLAIGFSFGGIILYSSSYTSLNDFILLKNSMDNIVSSLSIDNSFLKDKLPPIETVSDKPRTFYLSKDDSLSLDYSKEDSYFKFDYKEEIESIINPPNSFYEYEYKFKKISLTNISSISSNNVTMDDITLIYENK